MKAYEEYQRKLRDLAAAKEYLSKIGAALKARNRAAMTTRKRHVATERW